VKIEDFTQPRLDGTPPPLFDPDGSDAAMAKAVARVDRAADPDWKEEAYAAGVQLCRMRERFTADDMWTLVAKPREPRALGPVMRRLVKDGHCIATRETRRSEIPVHHRCPLRVYRSLWKP
jgi:hypothetical protein